MVMAAAQLATELNNNMVLVDNETDAINNLSTSWENYFANAAPNGLPVNPGTLIPATNAFKAAAIGMSAPNAGTLAIQNAIIAFWGIVAVNAPLIWTNVPPFASAAPPPALATIKATLDPVFAANVAGSLDKATATLNIANAIHTLNLGGTCLIPPNTLIPIL